MPTGASPPAIRLAAVNGGSSCGCSGGGTIDPSPLSPCNEVSTCTSVDAPPQVFPLFHANGGGNALDSAAKSTLLVSRYAPIPGVPIPGGSVGASFRVNPQPANLVVQMAPPAGGTMDPVPLFTYNSGNTAASALGAGWTGTFQRRALILPFSAGVSIMSGTGMVYIHGQPATVPGWCYPPTTTQNMVYLDSAGCSEYQPDYMLYRYNSSGQLQYLQGRSGIRWTVTHDSGGKVRRVTDPFLRLTSFSYDGSNNVRRVQDPAGRITSFVVNSSANLRGCRCPMARSAAWRMIAVIIC